MKTVKEMSKKKNEGCETEPDGLVVLDEDSRKIFFFGEVTESKSMQFLLTLQVLDSTEGDIQVVLNSLGGETHAGYAMYDAMKLCKNRVSTYVFGNCYSIATLLIQGGSKRLAAPNSEFMIHEISAEVHGSMRSMEVKDLTRALASDRNRYIRLMMKSTGLTRRKLVAMMAREVYLDPVRAKELGLIDEIMEAG